MGLALGLHPFFPFSFIPFPQFLSRVSPYISTIGYDKIASSLRRRGGELSHNQEAEMGLTEHKNSDLNAGSLNVLGIPRWRVEESDRDRSAAKSSISACMQKYAEISAAALGAMQFGDFCCISPWIHSCRENVSDIIGTPYKLDILSCMRVQFIHRYVPSCGYCTIPTFCSCTSSTYE
jgi:hypothetical protein